MPADLKTLLRADRTLRAFGLGQLCHPKLVEIVALHDQAGLVDYVTCGSGSYFDFYKIMPTFLYPEKLGVDLAADVKGRVEHAVVIAESHIRTPENAEAVIASGAADLVSIVRGQIADPHLVNKAAAGRPAARERQPTLEAAKQEP